MGEPNNPAPAATPDAAQPGEVHRLRRRERLLVELLAISRDLHRLTLDQLIQRALDFAEAQTGSTIAFYHFVEDDQATISLQAWSTNTIRHMCKATGKGQHYPRDQAGIWAECMRTREPVVINDYASAANKHGMPDGHAPVRRLISLPVIRDGRIRSIAGVGNKADDYTPEDVEALSEVMETLWSCVEQKHTEERIRQTQKSESLGRMAGALAHQYNNLLAIVLGSLELARTDLPAGNAAGPWLNEAMHAVHRASDLGAQILAFLGQDTAPHERMDLSAACRRAASAFAGQLPHDLELAIDLPASGPVISGNPGQIEQVVRNLLRNAREAIGSGRGRIGLRLRPAAPADLPTGDRVPAEFRPNASGYVCISVTDTGGGIPPADIPKVFDPFFSTKFPGRGLGLPIALGAVRAHEGCIVVTSASGRGARFEVFLPVPSGELAAPATPAAPPAVAQPPAPPGAILVIDDEDAVRFTTRRLLERLGHRVIEASGGAQGVELYRAHRDEIRAVVTDLTMPGMNGWEALEALRRLNPALPAIICSGYDPHRALAGAGTERPQALLTKPYRLADLENALSRALAGPPTLPA